MFSLDRIGDDEVIGTLVAFPTVGFDGSGPVESDGVVSGCEVTNEVANEWASFEQPVKRIIIVITVIIFLLILSRSYNNSAIPSKPPLLVPHAQRLPSVFMAYALNPPAMAVLTPSNILTGESAPKSQRLPSVFSAKE